MSVLYRKFQNKNKKSATYGKWYGRTVVINHISTKDLAHEVAAATTVTVTDVVAVLTGITETIGKHLRNSESVTLEGLGSFRVGFKTKPADDVDAFNAKNIYGYRINYRPVQHFIANGEVSKKGFRKGAYAKDLLDGITASEAPPNPFGKETKKE